MEHESFLPDHSRGYKKEYTLLKAAFCNRPFLKGESYSCKYDPNAPQTYGESLVVGETPRHHIVLEFYFSPSKPPELRRGEPQQS